VEAAVTPLKNVHGLELFHERADDLALDHRFLAFHVNLDLHLVKGEHIEGSFHRLDLTRRQVIPAP
jgi:hypothetical protein